VHTASGASFVRKAAASALCATAGVPVVLHVHNGRFDEFARSAPAPLRRLVVATLTRAAVVVAVSEPMAAALRTIAPRARITTVANPVARFPDRDRPPSGSPRVVFAGRVGAAKGTFVLLEAWARLRPETRDRARLVVLGNGDVDVARELVDRLGIWSTCDVRGWVPHTEATTVIAGSDVLVLASRSEGQPLAVLEAMAAGLCVVATPVGGIPDLVEHGRTGLLVPPDDPDALAATLDGLLADPAGAARLGAAARTRVRRGNDIDVVVDQLDDLYRQAVGRAAREVAR
jgi:glycosyltransferase involved in cell wall biosynthesis